MRRLGTSQVDGILVAVGRMAERPIVFQDVIFQMLEFKLVLRGGLACTKC